MDDHLYLKDQSGAPVRRVPALCERRDLIGEAAHNLAYPGGDRMYQVLKERYYWSHLREDCITVCREAWPKQIEMARFTRMPRLSPQWKGATPLTFWCLDLVTRLDPPGPQGETTLVVAVCPFSKWVEAGALKDRSSREVTDWF